MEKQTDFKENPRKWQLLKKYRDLTSRFIKSKTNKGVTDKFGNYDIDGVSFGRKQGVIVASDYMPDKKTDEDKPLNS